MFIANAIPRVFYFKQNDDTIRLEDPNQTWSAEEVVNFYLQQHPILATATVQRPVLVDDELLIEFSPTIGTKG